MKNITNRGFSILCDFMDINRFMLEIYEKDWRNGVPVPFLEYALVSDWMDKSMVHRFRIWEDGDKIVGFVFYENPINHVFLACGRDTKNWPAKWWHTPRKVCPGWTEG